MINVGNVNKSSNDVTASKTKKTTGGASFSSYLQETMSKEDKASLTAASGVSSSDALLAIQMAGDDEEQEIRKKLLKRGKNLIEKLEEIRDGLLLGSISRESLINISRMVKERRYESAEPRLKEIMDEIELRVEVELAKLMK